MYSELYGKVQKYVPYVYYGTSGVQARVYSLVKHGHTGRLSGHTHQLWAETRPGAGAERQESSGDPDGEDWSGCGVTAIVGEARRQSRSNGVG